MYKGYVASIYEELMNSCTTMLVNEGENRLIGLTVSAYLKLELNLAKHLLCDTFDIRVWKSSTVPMSEFLTQDHL